VGAEDAGERGVELLRDAEGRLVQLAAGFVDRRLDPPPLAGDLVTGDCRSIRGGLEQVHHQPCRAHPEAGGDRVAREGRLVPAGLGGVRIVLGHRVRVDGQFVS
jgi:hypothetical protein